MGTQVITNVFASRTRIARLLRTEPRSLHRTFHERSQRPLPMRVLPDGPVLADGQEGDAVDVTELPMLKHFGSDKGRYITSGIVIAEDKRSGAANMSYHRATPHTRNELAVSLHSHGHLWRLLQQAAQRSEQLPIAMVVGGHPLFMLAAAARLGADHDERLVAGGLFGEPLEVVRTPRHGISVPANAEIVLEGFIDPRRHAEEGPFGEFTGYSSGRSTNNVFHVESVLRRADALLLSVTGGNSADHLNLSRIPRESEMAARITERFPGVVAIHYPTSGTHFHCYVSLRQSRPGEARQVMLALLGWDPYLKMVVAVDPDVDITDDHDVLWAVATRLQPHRDILLVDGLPGSLLDPSSTGGATSRMGLDATMGEEFEGTRIAIPEAIRNRAATVLDSVGAARDLRRE
jgi:2,5-furandicarboxylate decarboxylase 1